MMLAKIEIPKRSLSCTAGEHPFHPNDLCYTLIELDNTGWRRQDLCAQCWEARQKEGFPAKAKSFWQTTFPPKETKEELPKDKEERALALLRLALADDSSDPRETFVLALYLARKKFLHFRQEVEQLGETVYLYEDTSTEQLFPIKKTTLAPDDIDALQKKLAEKLSPQ